MKSSSLKQNLAILVGLYGLSLLAAAGCPAGGGGDKQPQPPTASIDRPAADVSTAQTASADRAEDAGAPAHVEQAKPLVDPIELNGPIFVDWPQPTLALLITGGQYGYIEPCGCSGIENQKGGLSRRHSLVKQLQGDGWPLAAVDVGSQVRRFGPQAEIQYAITAEALRKMNYSAVGFGPPDLRLSAGEIIAAVAGDDPEKSIFISANASLLGLNPKLRIVKVGGKKIGITSVLGAKHAAEVNNTEIEIVPAAQALREVMDQLAGCDIRVLLSQATREATIELAQAFPDFDVVVTADGGDEPPNHAQPIEGTKARLIEIGHKSQFAVVLGWFDEADEPLRYQRVPLDSRFGDSPEMKELMTAYQEQLRERGWDGLSIRAKRHPRADEGGEAAGQFVGSAACKECHSVEWDVWSQSKHAHATETLVKLDPPRQFDAECVRCHVTGWDVEQYVPFVGGYEGLDATPHLAGNGCENCHGPGAAHVAAENDGSQAEQVKYRLLMKQTKAAAKDRGCVTCHDGDNSLNFSFDKYWEEIEH